MRSIYIVLTRTKSLLSRFICVYKGDKYSHATLAFDLKLDRMYGFGRKYSFFPFYGRFRVEKINTGFLGRHRKLPGAIIKLDVTEDQYREVRQLVGHFVIHEKLYRYNTIGLMSSVIGKYVVDEYKYFCSEFVYYVLYKCDILDFGVHQGLVRPQSFYDNLKEIYEGDLKRIPILRTPVSSQKTLD